MAFGRESFTDCKQMDLMIDPLGVRAHPNYKLTRFERDPVTTSPLSKFLEHLKGKRKLKTYKTHPEYLQQIDTTNLKQEENK